MFELWKQLHHAPYHFPVEKDVWEKSMYDDVDSDGRQLFTQLHSQSSDHGMVQYGYSAFGFDESGEISPDIHYPIIRDLAFAAEDRTEGEALLKKTLAYFGSGQRVYAFFHYFGMSVCGRHGKLHEKERHIEKLLFIAVSVSKRRMPIWYSCANSCRITAVPSPACCLFSSI